MLSLSITEAAGVAHVLVKGNLTTHAQPIAYYLGETQKRLPGVRVVLDLSEADIEPNLSAGGFLAQSCEKFLVHHGRLAFCFDQKQSWFVSEMAKYGLDQEDAFGEVYYDVTEAVRSLSAPS